MSCQIRTEFGCDKQQLSRVVRDRDTRVATHDEVKRQHAAGPLRVLAIRPSSAAARGRTRCPKNRLHGVVAGEAVHLREGRRVRRWPNGIEITGKRNTSMTDTPVSAAPGLVGYAKRIDDPVSATIAAELATARLDRRRPRIRARLMWPSTAKLHACFHLSQRRQAARDDAVFNELIARLDEGDEDSDG
jgi:hypothetical protein